MPSTGYLVRETATGWVDQQVSDSANDFTFGSFNGDLPGRPDPVLGLLVNSAGTEGWAVGGQTGGAELQLNGAPGAAGSVQTTGIERFGPGPTPPVSTGVPITPPAGQVTFAFGGGSGCAGLCADNANQNLGPAAALGGAIARAATIQVCTLSSTPGSGSGQTLGRSASTPTT